GRVLTPEDLRRPGMPGRLARTLRTLHAGPPFRGDFDMFRLIQAYRRTAESLDVPLPPGYHERLPVLARIEAPLAPRPPPPPPPRAPAPRRSVSQRPGGRERRRRGPAPPPRRLGVQRQRGPRIRAGQRLPGARLRRGPGDGAGPDVLRRRLARPPGPPPALR